MVETRRKPTLEERLTPCEICGVCLSDRHHLLGFNTNGENLHCSSLCPTCHTLLHTAIGAIIYKRKRASQVWEAFKEAMGSNSKLVIQIENKVYETAEFILDMETTYS
jgi:hypothetical protein